MWISNHPKKWHGQGYVTQFKLEAYISGMAEARVAKFYVLVSSANV